MVVHATTSSLLLFWVLLQMAAGSCETKALVFADLLFSRLGFLIFSEYALIMKKVLGGGIVFVSKDEKLLLFE